jgi:enoyl-CoA hydratase/carnithine racemase
MPDAAVIYKVEGHVAAITLNRPAAGNAVNRQMARELADICRRINGDKDVYVAVLTGAGESFCTGSDEEDSGGAAEAIAGIECPVLVAINGDAQGQGLELALAGDIRIASGKARFGLPQVAGGLIPADGGTQRLPRIVGRGKALELLLTADTVTAGEALDTGLVSRVAPPDKLEEEVKTLAEGVAAKGPVALRYLKEAVNKGMDMTLEQGLRLEADLYFLLHTTADRTEGIRAFLEKRPPEFKGE